MILAWLFFGILISNISLSNQLRLPAITTNTRCVKENQKIQGFTPSQFFQCIRKGKKLYFEARYCPNVRNTFYETKQRCLPNIGGGEVRCQIPGKRCTRTMLGTMAYPNKLKANYYIVCLPNAVHICRCYENAIYDKSIHKCRYISTTTAIGRDDSHGMIPKIICKKSGIHSIVELEYPYKQKCALFCHLKHTTNKQFELNIICAPKISNIDENMPSHDTRYSTTKVRDDMPPEMSQLLAQEFLKSTNLSDSFEWLKEETVLGSPSTEDGSTSWTTDQNNEERPFGTFPPEYDETTSLSIEDESIEYDKFDIFNERPDSTALSTFSTTEDEITIITTEKLFLASLSTEIGSRQSDSDQKFTEITSSTRFVTDDETSQSDETTTLVSSTTDNGSTKSVTDQNIRTVTSGGFFTITEEETNLSTEITTPISYTTEDLRIKSTTDQNIKATTFSSESFSTDHEIIKVHQTSPTTEDGNTHSTTDETFKGSTTNILTSVTFIEEGMQSTTDQGSEESTFNTLFSTTEDETINPSSENMLLESSTIIETGSVKSTTNANLKEITSRAPSSVTDGTTTQTSSEDVNIQWIGTQNIETESFSSSTSIPSTINYSNIEFISTDFAPIKPLIDSLSQITTTEFSNSFSTAPTLDISDNLQTTLTHNLENTGSSSDATLLPTEVTDTSTDDEENLSSTESETEFSTTTKNVVTIEIDTQLHVESSTASNSYDYQSTVSEIKNSVNTLLPEEVISESTSETSPQASTVSQPSNIVQYSTVTSSTPEDTTILIEPADSDKDDNSTEAFRDDETTTSEISTTDDDFSSHTREDHENTSQKFTTENYSTDLNLEEAYSDHNIDDLLQSTSELEFSMTTINPNRGFPDETFASNENLEQIEHDHDSNVGMDERCVCSGKMRYRNSCKKHYHCNRIGNSDRFVQSQIMECDNCFQFNARKGICDFPENVPECSVDDGSSNRICTAEGNYSIPLETNCRKYYECKRNWRGVIELQVNICEVGRIFSERFQKCVYGCRCRNVQQLPNGCESKNTVLPDPCDCSKYYYCNNEKEVNTLQCSDQYVFDGERCELKSEVICDPTNVLRYLSGDDNENCNT